MGEILCRRDDDFVVQEIWTCFGVGYCRGKMIFYVFKEWRSCLFWDRI